MGGDRNDPSANLRIELRHKGQPIQDGLADIERRDVNEAGIAGDHGFVLVLSTALPRTCAADDLEVHATSGGTSFRLPGVAMEDICAFLRHDDASGAIVPCEAVWGAELALADPTIGVYRDAVYLPFQPHSFLDATRHWGVYGSDGRLIAEAAYRRGSDLALVGQSEALDLSAFDIVDAPFATMIYGGPVIAHYGHFILTSLARLWALDGSHPALFHSDPLIHDHRTPFIRLAARRRRLGAAKQLLLRQADAHRDPARAGAGAGPNRTASPRPTPRRWAGLARRIPTARRAGTRSTSRSRS